MKPTWYAIRKLTAIAAAAAAGVVSAAEIHIYGDIGASWWDDTVTAQQFVKDIAALDAATITVRINSVGGSVPDGLAIYNAMKRHPAHIITDVEGMAFSIASLIAMGGDEVRMCSNALLMVHAPWTSTTGNSAELRATADMLDVWATAMSTSYAAKTGKPQADMLALLMDGKDHYYTADEALASGFIDQITDAVAPAAMASAARDFGIWARYQGLPTAWLQTVQDKPAAVAPAAAAATPVTPAPAAPAAAAGEATPAAAAVTSQEFSMPQTNASGALTPEARAEVLAAESQRVSAIQAQFKPHLATAGVTDLLGRVSADHTVTPEAAGLQLLAVLGQNTTPVAAGRVITVEDERDKVRGAMESAIMARGNIVQANGERVRADASNPFRGRSLLAIAEACLISAGYRGSNDPRELVAAAFTQTSSDFPVLLQNIMHKTLLGAYAIQSDTWSKFCAVGEVSDFRVHNRYRLGSFSNLESRNEAGEYRTKTINDGEKATITAGTKGNIINITREAVINDDMGAFTGLAAGLGRAAKRTIEADVYAMLALNSGMGPTMLDGLSLFHASHNNVIASGTAPTVSAFETMRVLLRAQKDVSGNDYLEVEPAVWLGPDSLVGQAKAVVNSTFDPDTNNKLQRVNIAYNLVQQIIGTPRLSGTPHFIFADPNVAPVLEVAFLNGVMEPYMEVDQGFTNDGARWKVRMDYGIAPRDFRGAVRNAGA